MVSPCVSGVGRGRIGFAVWMGVVRKVCKNVTDLPQTAHRESGPVTPSHENRVSVINLTNFKYEKAITLPVTNLNMMRVSDDKLWISTYGESSWSQDAAGNWIQSVSAPMALVALKADGTSKVIEGVHADKMTLSGNTIYAIGNDAEMTGGYDLCLYKVDTATENVETIHFAGTDLAKVGYPYCILVNPLTSDILIADASFTGDSTLYCFTKDYKNNGPSPPAWERAISCFTSTKR